MTHLLHFVIMEKKRHLIRYTDSRLYIYRHIQKYITYTVRRTSRLPGPGQYDSLSPVKYGKVSNSLTSMMRKDPVF